MVSSHRKKTGFSADAQSCGFFTSVHHCFSPVKVITTMLLLLFLTLLSCGGSEVIGTTGGSEVVGKLLREDSNPVTFIEVKALLITVTDSTKVDTTVVQVTLTNEKGAFKFQKLPIASYTLYARYQNDSLILPMVTFTPDTSEQVDLKTIIMRAPGAIQGQVNRTGISSSTPIFCGIPGTSHFAIADSNGKFTISLLEPEKTYSLEILCNGYLKQTIGNIRVSSGDTSILQETITLKIDPAGTIPAPEKLTYHYDSLSGKVMLTWQPVAVEDVHRYTVYYKDSARIVDSAQCTLTIFDDLTDTLPKECSVQVAALDDQNNEGSKSIILKFTATPPSWFRVSVELTSGTPDSAAGAIPVIMSFSSKLSLIDTVIWSIGHRDSILQKQDFALVSQGSDTLNLQPSGQARLLFVILKKGETEVYVDIVDASSFNPVDTWKQLDSLAEKRRYAGSCAIHGKLYVFGGAKENLSMSGTPTLSSLKTAERFDISTGKWEKIAPMNVARQKAASAVVDGKIYVFGGTSGNVDHRTVEMYDPSTNQWSITDSMPQTLIGASACVHQNTVYITGGMSGTLTDAYLLDAVTSYDPATKQWQRVGTLSTPRQLHSSLIIDNCLMTLGGIGYDSTESSAMEVLLVETFPLNDACDFESFSLSSGFFGAGAAAIGNNIYVFGGIHGVTVNDLPQNTLDVLSIKEQTITTLQPLPIPLEGVSVVCVDKSIFVLGGSTPATPVAKSTRGVYVYYP